MKRACLLALLMWVATACGGGSRAGSANTGGGSITVDGIAIDGATHSAFDNQGDALALDAVIEGSGYIVVAVDTPSMSETES